jgi:hypothetical protein
MFQGPLDQPRLERIEIQRHGFAKPQMDLDLLEVHRAGFNPLTIGLEALR